jgi:transposase
MNDTFVENEEMVEEVYEDESTEASEQENSQQQSASNKELVNEYLQWLEEGKDTDAIVELLHNNYNLSYPAAVRKIAALRKEAGLTKPRGTSAEKVQAFIQEQLEAGKERSEIIAMMQEEFGYTKHSASSTFSIQGKKLGITGEGSRRSNVPMEEVVAFARANAHLKRSEFTEKMAAELDYSPSTAGAFYTYLGFAQEYARQECEAQNG